MSGFVTAVAILIAGSGGGIGGGGENCKDDRFLVKLRRNDCLDRQIQWKILVKLGFLVKITLVQISVRVTWS